MCQNQKQQRKELLNLEEFPLTKASVLVVANS
jgi:hypothetical protein